MLTVAIAEVGVRVLEAELFPVPLILTELLLAFALDRPLGKPVLGAGNGAEAGAVAGAPTGAPAGAREGPAAVELEGATAVALEAGAAVELEGAATGVVADALGELALIAELKSNVSATPFSPA